MNHAPEETAGTPTGIVPVRRKPQKCPRCHGTTIVNLIYGYIALTGPLDPEKEALAGCVTHAGVRWMCSKCELRFLEEL